MGKELGDTVILNKETVFSSSLIDHSKTSLKPFVEFHNDKNDHIIFKFDSRAYQRFLRDQEIYYLLYFVFVFKCLR